MPYRFVELVGKTSKDCKNTPTTLNIKLGNDRINNRNSKYSQSNKSNRSLKKSRNPGR